MTHWKPAHYHAELPSHFSGWKVSNIIDQYLTKNIDIGCEYKIIEGVIRVTYSSYIWAWEEICYATPENYQKLDNLVKKMNWNDDTYDKNFKKLKEKFLPLWDIENFTTYEKEKWYKEYFHRYVKYIINKNKSIIKKEINVLKRKHDNYKELAKITIIAQKTLKELMKKNIFCRTFIYDNEWGKNSLFFYILAPDINDGKDDIIKILNAYKKDLDFEVKIKGG